MARYWLERPGKKKRWGVGAIVAVPEWDISRMRSTLQKLKKRYALQELGEKADVGYYRVVGVKKKKKKNPYGPYRRTNPRRRR